MTATSQLTTDLKALVLRVEDDLRRRLAEDANLTKQWQDEHREANKAERSAAAWETFRDDRLTQAAVSWVLTTVFIRFCEDNALLSPVWIAGPPERRQEALDAENDFFREYPTLTYREWIGQGIKHLTALPATKGLVAPPAALNLIAPSGDMAGEVLQFWRRRTSDGELVHDLRDESLSTRFLGDLYQDLSEYAKKTFALLQTPVFVEEFILDQTLTPALAERPLEGFTLIDPTCGSGHFLLGAFDRFVALWREQQPELPDDEVVRRALASVHGVDINGFAVAIARFRLTVAALQAMGRASLEDAPELDLNLAAGDSLLSYTQDTLVEDENLFSFQTEDTATLACILRPGTYDVVVGNPPYITVKDRSVREAYRNTYSVCRSKFPLSVPFTQRLFELARAGEGAGWVGQVTSNSFMTRESGKRLVEEFLPSRDLTQIIDLSGCELKGHPTPVVLMFGRNQKPQGEAVRTVFSKASYRGIVSGESAYWEDLLDVVQDGRQGAYFDVRWSERSELSTHPWVLAEDTVANLVSLLGSRGIPLNALASRIGFMGIPGVDEAMIYPRGYARNHGLPESFVQPLVEGVDIRDFSVCSEAEVWFPYDRESLAFTQPAAAWQEHFWRVRAELLARVKFSGEKFTPETWLRWHQLPADSGNPVIGLCFAEVATHFHVAVATSQFVYKQTAPIIVLSGMESRQIEQMLEFLGCSTVTFWLRTKCYLKGRGAHVWLDRYQFNASNVGEVPVPAVVLRAESLGICALPDRGNIEEADPRGLDYNLSRARSIQEENDWRCYHLFKLTSEQLTYDRDIPEVGPGERAFEIAMAARNSLSLAQLAWFEEAGIEPVTEIPARWPEDYRALVQRRIDLIESDKSINLLERPEYKRRWAREPWEKKQEKALRNWLLDRLESREYWFDAQGRPAPRSVNELADLVGRDTELMEVLRLWEGRAGVLPSESLRKLLVPEAVPYLAALRFKDTGMRKFEAWKKTWDLQRQEDAGVEVGTISVPPKYTSADFRKTEWWQARGKLDVPKERFVLYPDAGRSTDTSELLGWAGWNHLEQALALGIIIGARQAEGWDEERLVPLVAGLAELQPWVEQWHGDYDPTYGMSMAEFTREQLRQRSQQVDRTLDELDAWRPAPTTRGRKPRA